MSRPDGLFISFWVGYLLLFLSGAVCLLSNPGARPMGGDNAPDAPSEGRRASLLVASPESPGYALGATFNHLSCAPHRETRSLK